MPYHTKPSRGCHRRPQVQVPALTLTCTHLQNNRYWGGQVPPGVVRFGLRRVNGAHRRVTACSQASTCCWAACYARLSDACSVVKDCLAFAGRATPALASAAKRRRHMRAAAAAGAPA